MFIPPLEVPASAQHPVITALKLIAGAVFVAPAVAISAVCLVMIGCWLGAKWLVGQAESLRPAPRPRHDPIPAKGEYLPRPAWMNSISRVGMPTA